MDRNIVTLLQGVQEVTPHSGEVEYLLNNNRATEKKRDFKTHKGYITETHTAALAEHGPSPVHRMRFVNVRRAAGLES